MKYYVDGFVFGRNPSPEGGGFTITDNVGSLVHRENVYKNGFTNNEAELLALLYGIRLAKRGDLVSTDSDIAIGWVIKGKSTKARKDLHSIAHEAHLLLLLRKKKVKVIWERRHKNLAGIFNEKNPQPELLPSIPLPEEPQKHHCPRCNKELFILFMKGCCWW